MDDIPDPIDPGYTEWHARMAIRDLLSDYHGNRLKISLLLSVWLEEEYQDYINDEDNTP
jgi:hypothetical protein